MTAWVSWSSRRRLNGAPEVWRTGVNAGLLAYCNALGEPYGAVDTQCSRPTGHPGRHMAAGIGDFVIAAWPGTHPPVKADLRDEVAK